MNLSSSTFLAVGAVLGLSTAAAAQAFTTRGNTARLAGGDYVLPRFAPTGQRLAISQVLADSGPENTQILVLNVTTFDIDTLLTAPAAKKYATYKAYVSDFEWLNDSSLLAWIPDGDVGATAVTFDVRRRRITREEHHEGEEETVPPYQRLADTLARLYPEVAPSPQATASDVFGSGLSWPNVRSERWVLLQKRYAGVDDDVWLFRLDRRDLKRVLSLSGGVRASLAGGFASSRGIIFGAGSDTVGIYRWRGGHLDTLALIPARPQASRLSVRGQRGDSVWFLLRLHPSYERGNNPAFLYDGERLVPLGDYAELVDFDVHPATHRVAFLYWDGKERHLELKRLVPRLSNRGHG